MGVIRHKIMSYKQTLFIALGPIVGVSTVQVYFGNFTLLGFALNVVVCVAGAFLMAFISSIGKKPSGE